MSSEDEKKGIEVLSHEARVFPPPSSFKGKAHIDGFSAYKELYDRSIQDPEGFWGEMAERFLLWDVSFDKSRVSEYDFTEPKISWFSGGKLNVSRNCLDRHIEAGLGDKVAIIWEADNGDVKKFTYSELALLVRRFANVLKRKGIKKGDRVTIYMPMIPELSVAMLACARIGAIHSVVFGGFSSAALRDRIKDSDSALVVTADEGVRGGKTVPLKVNVDEALKGASGVSSVIVVKRTGADVLMQEGRDSYFEDEMSAPEISDECEAASMESEDPLFILYTSGSTGKPKGILHTTAGYLLFSQMTFKYVFDYHPDDIYFCTADIGWVTGHSYIVYGPLSEGATVLMFEGVPTYPTPSRFWEIVEKHKVSIFYTAPTAIRALMRCGEDPVKKHDLSSLRVLGSVGEPINPEAWMW
ncbi:MAG: AMP-binding protein, partial [Deltaproteobacteria bacterium]|nr:AMP-binding protein [Deltaproteobacteria bacterium]